MLLPLAIAGQEMRALFRPPIAAAPSRVPQCWTLLQRCGTHRGPGSSIPTCRTRQPFGQVDLGARTARPGSDESRTTMRDAASDAQLGNEAAREASGGPRGGVCRRYPMSSGASNGKCTYVYTVAPSTVTGLCVSRAVSPNAQWLGRS